MFFKSRLPFSKWSETSACLATDQSDNPSLLGVRIASFFLNELTFGSTMAASVSECSTKHTNSCLLWTKWDSSFNDRRRQIFAFCLLKSTRAEFTQIIFLPWVLFVLRWNQKCQDTLQGGFIKAYYCQRESYNQWSIFMVILINYFALVHPPYRLVSLWYAGLERLSHMLFTSVCLIGFISGHQHQLITECPVCSSVHWPVARSAVHHDRLLIVSPCFLLPPSSLHCARFPSFTSLPLHLLHSLTLQAGGTCAPSWTAPCRTSATCTCWWRRRRSRRCAEHSWRREGVTVHSSTCCSRWWWDQQRWCVQMCLPLIALVVWIRARPVFPPAERGDRHAGRGHTLAGHCWWPHRADWRPAQAAASQRAGKTIRTVTDGRFRNGRGEQYLMIWQTNCIDLNSRSGQSARFLQLRLCR